MHWILKTIRNLSVTFSHRYKCSKLHQEGQLLCVHNYNTFSSLEDSGVQLQSVKRAAIFYCQLGQGVLISVIIDD